MSYQDQIDELRRALANQINPNGLRDEATAPLGSKAVVVDPASDEFVKIPSLASPQVKTGYNPVNGGFLIKTNIPIDENKMFAGEFLINYYTNESDESTGLLLFSGYNHGTIEDVPNLRASVVGGYNGFDVKAMHINDLLCIWVGISDVNSSIYGGVYNSIVATGLNLVTSIDPTYTHTTTETNLIAATVVSGGPGGGNTGNTVTREILEIPEASLPADVGGNTDYDVRLIEYLSNQPDTLVKRQDSILSFSITTDRQPVVFLLINFSSTILNTTTISNLLYEDVVRADLNDLRQLELLNNLIANEGMVVKDRLDIQSPLYINDPNLPDFSGLPNVRVYVDVPDDSQQRRIGYVPLSSLGSGGGLTTQQAQDLSGNTTARHTHANKATLDKFGEDGNGKPTYNGNAVVKTAENLTPPASGTITVTLDNPQGKHYTGTATALQNFTIDTTPANLVLGGYSIYLYNGLAHPNIVDATWLKSRSSYDVEANHISGQEYYLVFANGGDGRLFWLELKEV